jgi:hypothetical protein
MIHLCDYISRVDSKECGEPAVDLKECGEPAESFYLLNDGTSRTELSARCKTHAWINIEKLTGPPEVSKEIYEVALVMCS